MKFLSKIFSETSVALVLVALLVWFVNPLGFWMTDSFHMTLLGLIVACFSIFAMFLWRENVEDERERLHRYIGSRLASTIAGSLLLVGTVLQSFTQSIDLWLPATLAAMVLAKITGRWYAGRWR